MTRCELQADTAAIGVTHHEHRVAGRERVEHGDEVVEVHSGVDGSQDIVRRHDAGARRTAVDGQDGRPIRERDGERVELQGIREGRVEQQRDRSVAAPADVDACTIRSVDDHVGRGRCEHPADLPPDDLARRGPGDLGHDLDGRRHLVAGESLTGELRDAGGIGRGPRAPHDRSDGHGTPGRIRLADDGRVDDIGMHEQDRLDLDRGDVLATRDDEVVAPVHDGQATLLVERSQVAGMQPAAVQCRCRRDGVPVVAGEDRGP